jgi:hypothetical protein
VKEGRGAFYGARYRQKRFADFQLTVLGGFGLLVGGESGSLLGDSAMLLLRYFLYVLGAALLSAAIGELFSDVDRGDFAGVCEGIVFHIGEGGINIEIRGGGGNDLGIVYWRGRDGVLSWFGDAGSNREGVREEKG